MINYTDEEHRQLEAKILEAINKIVEKTTKDIHSEIYDSCSKFIYEHVINAEQELKSTFEEWLATDDPKQIATAKWWRGAAIRKKLFDENPELKDLRIKDLEEENERLRGELNRAWERRY